MEDSSWKGEFPPLTSNHRIIHLSYSGYEESCWRKFKDWPLGKRGLDYPSDDIQVLGRPCSIISKAAAIQGPCVNLVSISLECKTPKWIEGGISKWLEFSKPIFSLNNFRSRKRTRRHPFTQCYATSLQECISVSKGMYNIRAQCEPGLDEPIRSLRARREIPVFIMPSSVGYPQSKRNQH